MKSLLSILLCSLFFLQAQAGGPWPTGAKKTYFQLGFSTKTWDGRYEGTYANTISYNLNHPVTEHNIGLYGEYGISDQLSLIAESSILHISTDIKVNADGAFSQVLPYGEIIGLGSTRISAKYSLDGGKLNKAVLLKVRPNLTSFDEEKGLKTGYDNWSYTAAISLGQGKGKSYWQFDIGMELNTNNYADNIVGTAQYGYKISPAIHLIADVNYVISLENGTYDDGNYHHTALYLDNQGFVATGLKVYAQVAPTLFVNVGYYSGFGVINQGDQLGAIFAGIAFKAKE